MRVTYPTIWVSIACLRKILSGRDTYYCQLKAVKVHQKKQKIHMIVDKRIFKIVNDYNSRDILTFLRGISTWYVVHCAFIFYKERTQDTSPFALLLPEGSWS